MERRHFRTAGFRLLRQAANIHGKAGRSCRLRADNRVPKNRDDDWTGVQQANHIADEHPKNLVSLTFPRKLKGSRFTIRNETAMPVFAEYPGSH